MSFAFDCQQTIEIAHRCCVGAPRPMKMRTTPSPWRYDAAALDALRSPNLRLPTIAHFASSCRAFKRRGFPSKPTHAPSLLARRTLLVPAAVGNESRKPRGRRHDQLPRESGKAKQQA
jgi:hypothetical protein